LSIIRKYNKKKKKKTEKKSLGAAPDARVKGLFG
jgi:hypothetical protein